MNLAKSMFTGLAVAAGLSLTTLSSAMAAEYRVTVTNVTAGIHFTPLVVAAHDPSATIFESGTQASSQLQAIAEGGDISGMVSLLESLGAGVATGSGLLAPGSTESFTVSGNAGDVLSLAGMLLPTNDGFVGLNSVRLPSAGTVARFNANGYDAGTEGNDEVVGSGAPGEAGFPAPPPVVASGTGTGATGFQLDAEGFVHIHRNVIGDLDAAGGMSDINAAVHRWLNPVAQVSVTRIDGGSADSSVTAVNDLSAVAYSSSAIELFWQPASSASGHIVSHEIHRDGNVIASTDGSSFFEDGLAGGTSYQYSVVAIDNNGNRGPDTQVTVTTNAQ